MKIHCIMAVLVVIAGIILKLSPVEWCICLGLFGLVMALELVNTAVESVVDLVTSEYKPLAKIAKDTEHTLWNLEKASKKYYLQESALQQ